MVQITNKPAFAALLRGEGKKKEKTMKKLLIALAAVAVAAGVQAASFNWKTSATGKVYNPGTETLLASATAYLFDTSVSQVSLVTDFAAGTLNLASKGSISGATASIADGKIAGPTFNDSTAVGSTLTAYFATVVTIDEKDYLFISGNASGLAQEGKTTSLSFNAKDASQAAALDASKGYSAAGWYTMPSGGGESVPEPTSGLLMLIGAAGLALRRKRA